MTSNPFGQFGSLYISEARMGSHLDPMILPKESTPTKYQSMSYALFDSDLIQIGIRVIRFPKKVAPNDPYGRLSKLIELLSNAVSDKDSIWNQ